jgi:hypothetical protein
MITPLEQRAAELEAARAQKALLAFETKYQELLAPIAGSRLTYKVVPTKDTTLILTFEQVPTGERADFLLLDSGQLGVPNLPEMTPNQLLEVLAEQVVNWQKTRKLRQWEQQVKPLRLFGELWPVFGMVGINLCMGLMLEYDRGNLLMSTGRLLLLMGAFLAPALVAFVTDWGYQFTHRLLAEAITFSTSSKPLLASPCSA